MCFFYLCKVGLCHAVFYLIQVRLGYVLLENFLAGSVLINPLMGGYDIIL